jgi:isoamylase
MTVGVAPRQSGMLTGQRRLVRTRAEERGRSLIDDDFLVLVNSWWEPLGFVLPETRPGAQWQAEIDSYDPAAPARAVTRIAGDQVTVGLRSVAVPRAASPR